MINFTRKEAVLVLDSLGKHIMLPNLVDGSYDMIVLKDAYRKVDKALQRSKKRR